jgi:uncharacterized membrane protein (UPF0127 family)
MRFPLPLALLSLAILPLPAQVPTEPNVGLETITLHLGKSSIKAEIAATQLEDETGLMFRHSLGDNDGMLFFLPGPQTAEFWMKNCFIPLSVAFIGKDGTILEIHDMQAPDPRIPDGQLPRTRSDSDQVFYAVEANLHWFSLNGVKAGDRITPPPADLKDPVKRKMLIELENRTDAATH